LNNQINVILFLADKQKVTVVTLMVALATTSKRKTDTSKVINATQTSL